MTRVAVKPALYRWAQQRSGVPRSDLTTRFPRLPEWEGGEAEPTLKQLERLARATYTPVGFFFLDRPPEEPLPIPDLRSGPNRGTRPSPHLLDTIYICQQRQEWFRDYARTSGDPPLDFVGSLSMRTPPAQAAATIRQALGFELENLTAGNVADALTEFIGRAEALGILVMRNGVVGNNTHRKLDPDEFRGFALSDSYAPLVFLNGADSKSAQMFTLAHELGHLWLGRSALDDSTAASMPDDTTERWCNEMAAELLVPMAALKRDAGTGVHLTEISKVGRRFATALISSTLEGTTLYRDAFRLLSISKDQTFTELGRHLQVII